MYQMLWNDWAVCSGNPFGLDQTLTGGLVSAVGREIKGVTGLRLLLALLLA